MPAASRRYPTSTRAAPESSAGRRTPTSGDIADDGEIGDGGAPHLSLSRHVPSLSSSATCSVAQKRVVSFLTGAVPRAAAHRQAAGTTPAALGDHAYRPLAHFVRPTLSR